MRQSVLAFFYWPLLAGALLSAEPKLDALGDPLPEGALHRFGSSRLRVGSRSILHVLSPDEKLLFVTTPTRLYLFDMPSGKLRWINESIFKAVLEKKPIPVVMGNWNESPIGNAAISPDGVTVALLHHDSTITLLSAADGSIRLELPHFADETSESVRVRQPCEIRFTPDGKSLTCCRGKRIGIYNLGSNRIESQFAVSAYVQALSPNCESAILADSGYVYIHDFKKAKTYELSGKPFQAGQFQRDGKRALTLDTKGHYTIWDVSSRLPVHEWTVPGAEGDLPYGSDLRKRCFLCDDGKTVVDSVRGTFGHQHEIGLVIRDIASRKTIGEMWTNEMTIGNIFSIGPDEFLTDNGRGQIRRWNWRTRREVYDGEGYDGRIKPLFSPDGSTILITDRSDKLDFYDTFSGKRTQRIRLPMRIDAPAVSCPATDTFVLRAGRELIGFDWSSRKETGRHSLDESLDPIYFPILAISEDGRYIYASQTNRNRGSIVDWLLKKTLWDTVPALPTFLPLIFRRSGLPPVRVIPQRWSAVDWQTGRELPDSTVIFDQRASSCSTAMNGRWIVLADSNGPLNFYDSERGKQFQTLELKGEECYVLGRSRNGYWLAATTGTGRISLVESFSNAVLAEFPGSANNNAVYRLDIAPDCRSVVTAGAELCAVQWTLEPKDIPGWEPDAIWKSLQGADGPTAYRATWACIKNPEAAIVMIENSVKAGAETFDAKRVEEWINELGSPAFRVREAAQRKIEDAGNPAREMVREALKRPVSTEQRQRLGSVLEKPAWRPRPEHFGKLRALQILEMIRSPAAKKLLIEWAKAKDSYLSEDAEEALKRIR